MSKEFPVAHVGNYPVDSFGAGGVGHELGIHKSDVRENLLVGEKGNSEGGEHIGSEACKNFAGELRQFLFGFIFAISGAKISQDDFSHSREKSVADASEEFTQAKYGGEAE